MTAGLSFASPFWLLGLVPWAAIAIYLLNGKPRDLAVPMVDFWRDLPESLRQRRGLQWPPVPVIAALVAALLAILTAAAPIAGGIKDSRRPVTIIVDRGITMSARLRFQSLATSVSSTILRELGPGPMTLCLVPDGRSMPTDRANWTELIGDVDPTAADTLKGVPVITRASTPPIQASGICAIRISVLMIDSVAPYRMPIMMSSASGMTIIRR